MLTAPAPRRPLPRVLEHYQRYVEAVCAQPRRAGLLLLLLSLPALALTSLYFADVHANMQELLPASSPSVRALDQLHGHLGGKSHLTVIAQSPDASQNRRFISEMAARMEARHLPEVRSVQAGVVPERTWLEGRAPLLLPRDRFDQVMNEIDEAMEHAKARANPLFVDLGEESGDAAWSRVEKRIDDETSAHERFPHGYIETPDGRTVVMVVWLEGNEVDVGPSTRLLAAAQREANAIRGKYGPDLQVAWNGEVPNMVEEHAAILADLSLSTAVVCVLVGLLITLYFRSWRAVLVVVGALVPGLIFTFAIARLTAGSLNSNTAFLGSIIAGNGINYPLIVLAFYRACDPSWPMPRAIAEAARRALPGTLGAAATASAAYAGLAASSFRGFSQFGWIGGIGMLVTWALSFLTIPILIAQLRPPRQRRPQSFTQSWLRQYFERGRAAKAVAALLVALSLAGAGFGALRAARSGLFEMDLRTLRNRESVRSGSASWDRKMNEVFGVWLNPVASVVEDPALRRQVASELERVLVKSPQPVAERVETIDQLVPPPDEQEHRLARLRKVAAALEDLPREQIPERARPWVDRWFAADKLHPITIDEVPPAMRQNFTELSGRADRVVLVYPSLKVDFDDARNVLRFTDELANAKLPEQAVTGGSFLFMAEIVRLVHDEAPVLIATVCVLVALVLLPIYWKRPRRVLLTVGVVASVAVVAQAIMVALGVRVNMLNFAAVPITIGVGSDYVVNLYGAMDALNTDARRACARMGGAIFLCSLTTVVGYLSLIVAQSGALRSFGWAAVLGEIMAVTTVLLVLPVVMKPKWS